MPSWRDRLAGLLGGKSTQRSKRRRSPGPRKSKSNKSNTYVEGTGERAALIKEAMEVYHRRQGEARGVLDQALEQMRKKPPKTVSENEKLLRLLELHQANLGLKALMAHDLRRYLVLSGIRGLLEDLPVQTDSGASRVPSPTQKSRRSTVSKR